MARALSGQVVVVTGASSGVGRAIARAFGRARSRVGLIARTREALENAAREIREGGGEALVLPLDVSDARAVQQAADEVAAKWGRIDTWVNDAMVSVFSPVSQTTPEAVHTPHFEVMRTRLPRHPKPVPPIYQPEAIAQAVLRVAAKPVREMWLAPSAIAAIVGQRLAPGLLDRYLGRRGYEAQQTGEPVAAGRPDNLFAPLPGDRGAHGRFDAEARPRSLEISARLRARALAVAAAAAGVVAFVGIRAWRT